MINNESFYLISDIVLTVFQNFVLCLKMNPLINSTADKNNIIILDVI